ncbi:fimbrial protein [Klebsiella aerogenes]|uniref:fimbrial protein n=1 Tax=Klebsiella aerogenes TaxID=548 RepID=UPI00063CE4DE|nr:fimbrial protein [Klebsiella aerogenes]KLE96194.1 fimbria A protein [Klebsiella aerogenes]
MKLNKIASIFVMTFGIVVAGNTYANQGSGTVTFTGSIIDAACSVNPDSSEQEIDLGQIASAELMDKGTSTPRNFDIKLEKCTLKEDGKAPTVKVTFGGSQAVAGDTNLFGITGDASGAGIVITDGSGAKIPVGGTTNARSLIVGNNTLSFSAYLQGLGGALTTGDFYSVTNFTLAYD